jgi:hypothetical protein
MATERQKVRRDIERKQGKGIETIIHDAEAFPLSGEDIMRICDEKVKVMLYEDLADYTDIDQVLEPHDAVVILYRTTQDFGHWVALLKTGERQLEFYDPYGLKVDEELKLSDFHTRIHEDTEVFHLTHLIQNSGYRVKSNKERLQQKLEDVNTCGRYASMRVRLREFSMKRFNDLLTKNRHYDPDFWISSLTLFI